MISAFEVAAQAIGLSSETASYLPTAYGANTEAVLALVSEDSSLSEPVSGSHPYILAQVIYQFVVSPRARWTTCSLVASVFRSPIARVHSGVPTPFLV